MRERERQQKSTSKQNKLAARRKKNLKNKIQIKLDEMN